MILPQEQLQSGAQGVFLELLVTAKSAIIQYPAGYQHDIRLDSGYQIANSVTNQIPDSEKWAG